MIYLEIVGSIFVVAAISAFSQGWLRAGFWFNIASAIMWTAVAIHAELYGLLALQGFITAFAVRGLWRLRRG